MSSSEHRIFVTTIGDLLLGNLDNNPDHPALIFPDRRHSYAELTQHSYERAQSLLAMGVRPGDHVGILMANSLEFMETIMGCALIGAIAIPMNARYKPQELAYVVENADLTVLVTSDSIADHADFGDLLTSALGGLDGQQDRFKLALSSAPKLKSLIMLGNKTPTGFVSEAEFNELATTQTAEDVDAYRVRIQLTDPAIMMYTSGTTANPKGCPLSHGLLVRNGVNMNRERYFLTNEDVFWAPLPMFHMAAVLPFLACLDAGAAMSSMVHVEPGLALEMLERDKVAVAFPSFPTITNDLISHPTFASRDLSNLRRINNVAPIEMLRRFQQAFPQAVQTGAYGLTEAGGVISYNHPSESLEVRLTTCGKPFPGIDVKVVEAENLQAVATGERGELWTRGYNVFEGYYKSPEKNAESFVDGWFRTGDLCSLTEDGAICYHGRIKDMLKVGGENVAAIEIESCLASHPSVTMAQVIGREDDRLQEVPVAFIELKPNAQATEDELVAHCRAELASFKVPRKIYFVTEWPMSSTKVQKFKLHSLLKEVS
jgi:fatty-acyl-CoA synthase